jgi:protease IV
MIKSFIKLCIYFCAAVGFLFFVFLTIGLYHQISRSRFLNSKDKVVILSLSEEFPEKAQNGFLNSLLYGPETSFSSLLLSLNYAEKDPAFKTLVVLGDNSTLGLAQTQELRAAVLRLKKAGKKTIFWAENMSLKDYYLASVFDERIAPETGEISLSGLQISLPFAKEGLEKFGVFPQFYGKFEYKSAVASLTDDQMPESIKKNMEEVLSNLFHTIVYETQTVFKKQADFSSYEELMNDAPFSAREGLQRKLLTQIAYYEDMIEEETQKNLLTPVFLPVYSSLTEDFYTSGKHQLALIYVTGDIQSGADATDKLTASDRVVSSSVIEQIVSAREDDAVKAILIRIDSDGGSYSASDAIRHQVLKAKAQKPVVCSIGNSGASGAYFIASACSVVLADSLSLTGSIGVFGGKIVFKDLLDKLGVHFDSVQAGKNADFDDLTRPWNEEQIQTFNKSLERVYLDFTQKVANSRHLTEEEMDSRARGRLFSGSQAQINNLIDHTGGLLDAIQTVGKILEYPTDFRFQIITYDADDDCLFKGLIPAPLLNASFVSVLKGKVRRLLPVPNFFSSKGTVRSPYLLTHN